MGEVARDWDEQLFKWIIDLEDLTRGAREDYLLDALSRLRAEMIEKLYAVGGEWADRYKRMQGS